MQIFQLPKLQNESGNAAAGDCLQFRRRRPLSRSSRTALLHRRVSPVDVLHGIRGRCLLRRGGSTDDNLRGCSRKPLLSPQHKGRREVSRIRWDQPVYRRRRSRQEWSSLKNKQQFLLNRKHNRKKIIGAGDELYTL